MKITSIHKPARNGIKEMPGFTLESGIPANDHFPLKLVENPETTLIAKSGRNEIFILDSSLKAKEGHMVAVSLAEGPEIRKIEVFEGKPYLVSDQGRYKAEEMPDGEEGIIGVVTTVVRPA